MRSKIGLALGFGLSGCALAAIAPAPARADSPLSSASEVHQIKIVADKAPDCSSLKSIIETVTRGCKTDDEKAIALYNFMRLTHFHRPPPMEKGGLAALKEINVYGWALCGGEHAVESALWKEMGWKWRFVGWSSPGHTTVEAQYGGKWHYLDVFLKFYAWMPDGKGGWTLAGEDDLAHNTDSLLKDRFELDKKKNCYYAKDDPYQIIDGKANWTAPAFLVSGDSMGDLIKGLNSRKTVGPSDGWEGISHATGDYSTDVNLAPGFSLTNEWQVLDGGFYYDNHKAPPVSTSKDYRNSPEIGPIMEPYAVPNDRRVTGSGVLAFNADFSSDAVLKSFAATDNMKFADGALVPAESGKPASVTVRLQSPYILCKASGHADGADSADISSDNGKTFQPVKLEDFTDAVRGKYDVLVRITFKQALKSLKLEAVIQNNKYSLPYLSPGTNKITVSITDAKELGDNKLVVTYAYCIGNRSVPYDELCKTDQEVGKARDAAWSATPTVVQKVFAAKDLPATFEIDVPTPKDKYPVYPKMLFIRREVIGPDAKPLPLPQDAAEPKMGPDDELKTLPNPFLIGTEVPSEPSRPK